MTRRAKKDGNHFDIAAELEKHGYQVTDTSAVGPNAIPGFPDLLVVTQTNCIGVLIEIKMPGEGLSSAEVKFHRRYKGPLGIAYSPDEALAIMAWFERGYVARKEEIAF
jgi:hypothetical protein